MITAQSRTGWSASAKNERPSTAPFANFGECGHGAEEWLRYREPCEGTVLASSWGQGPDGEEVLLVANLEGRPTEVLPKEQAPSGRQNGWSVVLATPGRPVTVSLSNSQAVLLTRERGV